MLTTKVISPKQGESYYAQENSYSAEESVENSLWFGKGAAELGLKGQVKSSDFEQLLHGELPNGKRFRKHKVREGYQERAGLDCTFSAPKSISLLALMAGIKEIEKAHKEAVIETLQIIERDYATIKTTKDGEVGIFDTKNLVVAQFDHDTSRSQDPHLHTHCVILNLSKHKDKWYSFRNEDVFANRKLLGSIYRNQLALKVKELGYSLDIKEDGLFEVEGFTPEQLKKVSKRRQQIISRVNKNTSFKEEEKIWNQTRNAKKKPISRTDLKELWRKDLGDIDYPKPNPNKEPDRERSKDKAEELDLAIDAAIEHCAERSVAFKPEAVREFVLSEIGKYNYQEVTDAIASNNELIHLDKKVTTQTALLRELETIKLMRESQNKFDAITGSEKEINSSIAGLTEGQKKAVTLAAKSKDRILAWQGKAGVGKTYALNQFKQLATDNRYMVKGFAPSAKAAQVLSEEMSIETSTVARKLVSKSDDLEQSEQQQIWIVDEAGLLGAKTALSLLQQAEEENARVLLVGDTRQLSSIEAGNPFKSLQQAGMSTAHLNQSLRQKTADLKEAVNLISDGKATKGIEILDKHERLTEFPELETRASQMAKDYLELSRSERDRTLVIAGTHEERKLITEYIRQGLKQEKILGKEVKATKLKSKSLTSVQKQYAHHYQIGDVVIPFAHYKRIGLEKNQQYKVTAVEKDVVTLAGEDNVAKQVRPNSFKHKDVYSAELTQIAIGDKLRWGKNDKWLNRANGEEFRVTAFDGLVATIETAKGKSEQINLENAQHLDHALVSTTYSSQGTTADRVLVSLGNNLTTNSESFYVAASRAKYDIRLYVEDRAELLKKVNSSKAQANPLELIRQYSATTIQTENNNNERNTASQSNSQRDFTKQSQPSRETPRKPRIEPDRIVEQSQLSRETPRKPRIEPDRIVEQSQLSRATPRKPRIRPDRIVELAEHINRYIDEQGTQSLKGSLRKFKQQLDKRFSATGRTAKLGNSIKRLDRTLAKYSDQRKRGEQLGRLDKVKNSIEESIITNDPKLLESAKKLQLTLNNQPTKLNRLKKLQSTINQCEKLQQNRKLDKPIRKSKQLLGRLDKVKNSIEESIITDDPKLVESAKKLQVTLNNRSKKLNNLKKLQSTINQYEKLQQKNKVDKLAASITDIQEQKQLEALTPAFNRLNSQLQNYGSNKSSPIIKKLQKSVDETHQSLKDNQQYLKLRQNLALDTSPDSSSLEVHQEKSVSHYQMELRQNYLTAKREVLQSNLSAPEQHNLNFDAELVKHLKSKSYSTSEIVDTLAQSDHVHNLLKQHGNNPSYYRQQVAKYIYSVGTKAGLSFNEYEKNKSPQKQKNPEPEIER